MKLLICSVLDKAVGAYLSPFFARSKAEAVRSFSDACSQQEHQFFRHATDYVLMEIGFFDDASGTFETGEPVRVISAIECVPLETGTQVRSRAMPSDINGGEPAPDHLRLGRVPPFPGRDRL